MRLTFVFATIILAAFSVIAAPAHATAASTDAVLIITTCSLEDLKGFCTSTSTFQSICDTKIEPFLSFTVKGGSVCSYYSHGDCSGDRVHVTTGTQPKLDFAALSLRCR